MSRKDNEIGQNQYRFDLTKSHNVLGNLYNTESNSFDTKYFGKSFINDRSISKALIRTIDSLYADFLDVALYVYLADRLSPRRKRSESLYQFQWSRKIHLKIPVRNPNKWNDSKLHSSLKHLLYFFTEDEWQLEFDTYKNEDKRLSESQLSLFQSFIPSPIDVALYSGGLDSFAGAIHQITDKTDHHFNFVSVVTNNRQGKGQQEQIKALRRVAPGRITHIPISVGLIDGVNRGEEISQRSRGFLFLALGTVSALIAGTQKLNIYENGIGAINLPYDGSQIGTSNTRAVNPISLVKMSQFISDLCGIDFRIENPFIFKTKGEMCSHPNVRLLGDQIGKTFSCDGFPIREKGKPQCGRCTSCLLRRLSLESAELSSFDKSTEYLTDCKKPVAQRANLRSLVAMEWQFYKIKDCLSASKPWEILSATYPSLLQVTSEISSASGWNIEQVKTDLLRLYTQYIMEWSNFSAHSLLHREDLIAT